MNTPETMDKDFSAAPAAVEGSTRISAEEERHLASAWRHRGQRGARDRLVTANLGLVVAIARRYKNSGVPLDELIAEGNLGLLRAVDGFDPGCGSRFSTYASYWIRQGISRAFAASTPRGRLNSRDRRDVNTLDAAARRHYIEHGDMPTVAELAETLGWPRSKVEAFRAMSVRFARPASLDQPRNAESGPMPHPSAPAPAPRVERSESVTKVGRLLELLSPEERAAVELRFGLNGIEPQSLEVIAKSLSRSPRQARLALRTAMAKLARRGSALVAQDDREGVERE